MSPARARISAAVSPSRRSAPPNGADDQSPRHRQPDSASGRSPDQLPVAHGRLRQFRLRMSAAQRPAGSSRLRPDRNRRRRRLRLPAPRYLLLRRRSRSTTAASPALPLAPAVPITSAPTAGSGPEESGPVHSDGLQPAWCQRAQGVSPPDPPVRSPATYYETTTACRHPFGVSACGRGRRRAGSRASLHPMEAMTHAAGRGYVALGSRRSRGRRLAIRAADE